MGITRFPGLGVLEPAARADVEALESALRFADPTVLLDEPGRPPLSQRGLRDALSAWGAAVRAHGSGALTFTGRAMPTPDGTILACSDTTPAAPSGIRLNDLDGLLQKLVADGFPTVALLNLHPGDFAGESPGRLLGAGGPRGWQWAPIVLDIGDAKQVVRALQINPDLPGKGPRRFAIEEGTDKRIGWLVVTGDGFRDSRPSKEADGKKGIEKQDRFPEGAHWDHWLLEGGGWPDTMVLREEASRPGEELDGILYRHKKLAHAAMRFKSTVTKELKPTLTTTYVSTDPRLVLEIGDDRTVWHADPELVDDGGYLKESVFPLTIVKQTLPDDLKTKRSWCSTS